jgi:2,5-diamino-6-(ribosylamino)-4(3H)-pyrimidinone 5'-phosphate reductase
MTHYLRSRHASILVGVGTAETDDPKLNCMFSDDGREVVGEKRQPVPVVLDPSARWSCRPDLNVMEEFGGRRKRVMWISGSGREGTRDGRLEAKFGSLEAAEEKVDTRVECRYRSYDEGTRVGLDWEHFLTQLAELGIQSLMVEGGAKVIEDLLRAENRRFVSSVILTIAPVWLGKGGVTVLPSRKEGAADVGRLRDVKWLAMGDDGVMAGRFA